MVRSFVFTLRLAGAVFSLALACPGLAEAERTVRFRFEVPPGCGTPQEFASAVSRRTPALHLVATEGGAPVTIRVAERDGELEARLLIALRGGGQLERTIDGATCREAVDAIAFVAAVALDPAATIPVAVDDQAGSTSPGLQLSPTPPTDSSPPPAHQPPPEPWEHHVGLGPEALWGPAPEVLLGGELAYDLGAPGSGWWVPSLRSTLGLSTTSEVPVSGGSARFLLGTWGLDACPSRATWGRMRLRPCLTGDVGFMRAQGSGAVDSSTSRRPWAAVGGKVLAQVSLGARWSAGAQGSLAAPLVRDSYQFEPNVFHRVPSLIGAAGAEIALRFW